MLADDQHSTGALQARTEALCIALAASGPVHISDTWNWVVNQAGATDTLEQIGVSESMLRVVNQQVDASNVELAAAHSQITLRGTLFGRELDSAITANPVSVMPANIVDALSRGRSRALAQMLARGESAYLYSTPSAPSGGAAQGYDVIIQGASEFLREGVAHVRRLEDTGLATYQGAGPASPVVFWLAVACGMLAIGIVAGIVCDKNSEKHPIACTISGIALDLAIIFFSAAAGSKLKTTGYYINGVWVPPEPN
jgi:hypothetical protein